MTKLVRRQQRKLRGADDCVEASFIIAQDIARNMKSFSDGDFIKECISHAAHFISGVSCKSVNDFERISRSMNIITKSVEELSCNIESILKENLRILLHDLWRKH